MLKQTIKNIRRYVKIKMKEEGLPESEFKGVFKTFKGVYVNASADMQKKYDQDMKSKFDEKLGTPAT